MSHLNDGHVGCWERLVREDVKPQPEGEIMEEYKRFLFACKNKEKNISTVKTEIKEVR